MRQGVEPFGRIDGANEIMMTGRGRESRQREAADGEEHAAWRLAERRRPPRWRRRHRSSGRRRLASHGGARERDERKRETRAGFLGIARHLRRERMGRVDHGFDRHGSRDNRRGPRRRRSRRCASRWARARARAVRPASDSVASISGRPARSRASAEASLEPPRMSTRIGIRCSDRSADAISAKRRPRRCDGAHALNAFCRAAPGFGGRDDEALALAHRHRRGRRRRRFRPRRGGCIAGAELVVGGKRHLALAGDFRRRGAGLALPAQRRFSGDPGAARARRSACSPRATPSSTASARLLMRAIDGRWR